MLKENISLRSIETPDYRAMSAWTEHIPFAFWLMERFRPKTTVELGVHLGMSYFSFCQAIRTNAIEGVAYAIDNWEGDEHAGYYGNDIFLQVERYNNEFYADFSYLIKSTFDKALDSFKDGSIDLLHIDGLHTYESVKADFENWLPKMSRSGVVLFHDINVREKDFGVYKLWDELTGKYPSFSFLHGHGLGVLAVGADLSPALSSLFAADESDIRAVRGFYYKLGRSIVEKYESQIAHSRVVDLSGQVAALSGQIESLSGQAESLTRQLVDRKKESDAALLQNSHIKGEHSRELTEYASQLAAVNEELAGLKLQLAVAAQEIADLKEQKEQAGHLKTALSGELAETTVHLAELTTRFAEIDSLVTDSTKLLSETNSRLTETTARLTAAELQVASTIAELAMAREKIALLKNEMSQESNLKFNKGREISESRKREESLEKIITDLKERSRLKEEEFEKLKQLLGWYKETFEDRSLAGVLKEKTKRRFQKTYLGLVNRMLAKKYIQKRLLATYLLEFVRDHGLNKFRRYSSIEIRKNKLKAFTNFRRILIEKMQQQHAEAARASIIPPLPPAPEKPAGIDIEKLKKDISGFIFLPKISIVVPNYNTRADLLQRAIDSVKEQIYPNWELCITDDRSTNEETIAVLKRNHNGDQIKIGWLEKNSGIADATNSSMKMSTGEYMALMDADDEIPADALYWFAKEINEHPFAEIIYTDECKIDESGNLSDFFYKPDWSPELLFNMMYVGHFTVYQRKFLFDKVGLHRKEFDYSQDYDLMLRAVEKAVQIRHIKKVLYYWRMTAGSSSQGDKPHARISNLAALADAVKRRKIDADIIELPTANRVKLRWTRKPKVSLVIPTDSFDNLTASIDSIVANTSYENYEIVAVTNSGLIKKISADYSLDNLVFVPYDKPYNFSDKCNAGARDCNGEIVIFFNDDVRPLLADWIENTIEYLSIPGVGGVSPKLIYENDTIQYAGMATGVRNLLGTTFHCYPQDSISYVNYPQLVRDVSILSGACMAMNRKFFLDLGGFDAINTPSAHSDVDLCFKILEKGYRCVYTPHTTLRHIGHLSLKEHEEKQPKLKKDKADIFLLKHWVKYLSEDVYFTDQMRNVLYHDSPEPFKLYAPEFPIEPGEMGDILIVSHDLSQSGAPISLFDTCKILLSNGYFVVVCAPADGPLRESYQSIGVTVITDSLLLTQHHSFHTFAKNFDFLICNTIVTWPVVKQLENVLPTIWWVQEGKYVEHFHQNADCIDILTRSKVVIGLSEYALSYIRRFNPHALKIYNAAFDLYLGDVGYDVSHRSGKLIFSLIGSIESRKGQDILLDALNLVDAQLFEQIEVQIIGRTLDPGFKASIMGKVRNKASIRFLGEFSHDECVEFMRNSDVILNVSRDEPFSVAMVEAFSLAKTCIVSTHTGIAELIEHGVNGFVFRHEDVHALAAILSDVIREKDSLHEIGLKARETYKNHLTMNIFEKKILSLLKRPGAADDARNNVFIQTDEFEGIELISKRSEIGNFYLSGDGIEIGALHKPLEIQNNRTSVKYVDYKTLQENIERYPEHVNETIVFTDIVDDGFILRTLPNESQDFVIANHALEHSPDPYGTLLVWHRKLRKNGIIYAAIPIAEKCYDKGRVITSLEHFKRDHALFTSLRKKEILEVTREHIWEFLQISDNNIRIMNKMEPADIRDQKKLCTDLLLGLKNAMAASSTYEDLITNHIIKINRIYDIHYHTFSPSSYEVFLQYFCNKTGSVLENVIKNGSGECIGIIRKI